MKNLIEKAKSVLVEKVSQDELNNLLDQMRGYEGDLQEVTFINKNNATHKFKITSSKYDVSGGNPVLYTDNGKNRIEFQYSQIKSIKYTSGGKKAEVVFNK